MRGNLRGTTDVEGSGGAVMVSATLMRFLLVLVLAAAVTGCGEPGTATGPEGGGDAADGGEGTDSPEGEWVLVDGVPQVDGYPITLRVGDGEVGGTAACNSYGGAVRISGDAFEVDDLSKTEMGCPDPGVHESESAYLDALMAVDRHDRDGEQLVLTGPDVELRFDPVPPEEEAALTGTVWRLESLIFGSGPDGAVSSTMAPAELELREAGTFSATDGCNQLDGRWEADGEVLRLTDASTTDMACPDAAQQADHVVDVLLGEPTFELDGRRLTLRVDELGLDYRAD
jgi:heat shock protein HslJ